MTNPAGSLRLDSIGQISIVVQDVARATAFYRDVLGLKFLFEFPGVAFFDCGGVRLYLGRAEKPEFAHTSILYYRAADIHAAARTLEERGVRLPAPPHKVHEDAKHELWLCEFKDSEGNNVALMSEVPKGVA